MRRIKKSYRDSSDSSNNNNNNCAGGDSASNLNKIMASSAPIGENYHIKLTSLVIL